MLNMISFYLCYNNSVLFVITHLMNSISISAERNDLSQLNVINDHPRHGWMQKPLKHFHIRAPANIRRVSWYSKFHKRARVCARRSSTVCGARAFDCSARIFGPGSASARVTIRHTDTHTRSSRVVCVFCIPFGGTCRLESAVRSFVRVCMRTLLSSSSAAWMILRVYLIMFATRTPNHTLMTMRCGVAHDTRALAETRCAIANDHLVSERARAPLERTSLCVCVVLSLLHFYCWMCTSLD